MHTSDSSTGLMRGGSRRLRQGAAGGLLGMAVVVSAGAGRLDAAPPTGPSAGAGLAALVEDARVDETIPAPGSVIGHALGADAVRYDALVRYLRALADSSPLVTLTPYGTTHEGRPLHYLTITSAANHDRLDAIRTDAARLADPRSLASDDEADRVVRELPGIAWLAYSIHGDEVSPCDSAMMVAYLLAAGQDESIRRLRDELVILIDPLQNPDGRERYLAQIQTLRGRVRNPDIQAMAHAGLWSAGRGNHYLFDLNRDWLLLVHPETRGRVAAILQWHPHLVVDAHEMGGLDTYLFDPPREPMNAGITPKQLEWRRRMSRDQAAAFDRYGWSYYTGEWYEEWYPGYTNAWATLNGAIGMLYEQAGVDGAAVRQAAGNVLTYEEAVLHNVVSSFANLETLRAQRPAILADYLTERRAALAGEDGLHRTFLFPPGRDRSLRARFLELLRRQGVEHVVAAGAVDAADVTDLWGERSASRTLPAGTIAVPARQPRGAVVHALLGFDPRLSERFLREERHELENGRESRVYDVTAWNIPMAYGLEAYAADRVQGLVPAADADDAPVDGAPADAAFGYLVSLDDGATYEVVARLLATGVRLRVARRPFTIGGRAWRRGTVLLRRNENGDDLAERIRDARLRTGVEVVAVDTALSDEGPDLGGQEFILLHPPRVAIASQWPSSTTSFGSAWYLLDHRIGLRTSPINIQNLRGIDLRTYNVLVVPSTRGLDRVLGADGFRSLRRWVEAGGTLVAIGGSAAALATAESGLSAVRRRRDMLDQLDVYDEAVARENAARNVIISPERVWGGGGEAAGESGGGEDATDATDAADAGAAGGAGRSDRELAARKREDEWARRFSPQGAIVSGHVNDEHWLCFGLDERMPLLVAGRTAFLSKPPVHTPVRLEDAEVLRLSGLLWPEARERLARSAYATVERVGNGQVILFAHDPFFRGYWEGTGRLFLNAVILGPGMGTAQPLPW